jgi:general secretion pathway protein D
MEKLLEELDVMPRQILIKVKIMEVDRNLAMELGVNFGSGISGATQGSYSMLNLNSKNSKVLGGQSVGTTPSVFTPNTTDLTGYGLTMDFQKLTGAEFQVVVSALEDDAQTNVLSSPTILTLNNQEASIMVGQKYPIVKLQTSDTTGTTVVTGGSLEKYENIGIQLNVVPQICGEDNNYVNIIVHPAISSHNGDVSVATAAGVELVSYPKIDTREAQTQAVIKDGETIVIGGLLKDIKAKERIGVPLLMDLPFIGQFFRTDAHSTQKIDLLIFITVHIVKLGEAIPEINNESVPAPR